MTYTQSFPIEFDPVAHHDAVIIGPQVRFTVLTPRLLRLEYSPREHFEDRPSQAFWYRRQPVPDFETRQENGYIEIVTEHLHLRYRICDAGFTENTLSVALRGSDSTWHYGQSDPLNLMGTTRTLDNVSGVLALGQGLVSRSGWAVHDDSAQLVFGAEGWLEPRRTPEEYRDLYFFGYGHDYAGCLRDFVKVAGQVPMLPRWALGNWWSRYWAYTADELLALMDDFRDHGVPLSVCIVDMDWHITDTGNRSSGWTGYTWNRELFPNPAAFFAELHQRGLRTALNLHPAQGVHPHEEQYEAMAERMGIDPKTQEPVPFDIADPKFTRAYFELLHHPYETDGVDFWWLDWQQGTLSGLPGLDPLWWLNHLHFYDLGRGKKRPFIFSRWGGLGNHRYPIGFSGDAVVTWESLTFQPYFTATAANVNHGWWSHDIGGHMGGIEEPELYARWVQYGVFSPILRLHSTNNRFHERRPWGYDAETERVASEAMRLRHALIPYLYTMSWRNHTEGVPLIRPMYYDHPDEEPAYHCPDQYAFGSELVAAPFISPADPDTQLSRQSVWLPRGDWFDFFSGARYRGDGVHAVHGGLDDIPVFAKAGAIVPLAPQVGWGGVDNPEALEIHVFPGTDNGFALYEDNGGEAASAEAQSLIPITQRWRLREWEVQIEPAQGVGQAAVTRHLPPERDYSVLFRGIRAENVEVTAERSGERVAVSACYDQQTATLRVAPVSMTPNDTLTVVARTEAGTVMAPGDYRLAACRKLVRAFRMNTNRKLSLDTQLPAVVDRGEGIDGLLADFELSLTPSQLRALAEVVTGAGYHRSSARRSQDEAVVVWNNGETEGVRFRVAAQDMAGLPVTQKGPLPRFGVFTIGDETVSFAIGNQPCEGYTTVNGWFDALPDRFRPEALGDMEAVVQFDIMGEGGRTAFLCIQEGQAVLADGVHDKPSTTIAADVPDWLALINGQQSPVELFLEGKIAVSGDLELVLHFAESLGSAPTGRFLADRWKLDVSYGDVLTLHLGAG